MTRKKPNGTMNLNHSALHVLHRAGQTAQEIFASAAGSLDLTPRQLIVLSPIHDNPKCNQTAIVQNTGIDRSTIAELIRRLEKRNLVLRKRSKTDARSYVVDLTEQGRTILKRGVPLAAKVDDAVLTVLGAKSRKDLLMSLTRMIDGLQSPDQSRKSH